MKNFVAGLVMLNVAPPITGELRGGREASPRGRGICRVDLNEEMKKGNGH